MFAVGFLAAFIVALIAMKTFLSPIKRILLYPVCYLPLYCAAAALRGVLSTEFRVNTSLFAGKIHLTCAKSKRHPQICY